MKRTVFLALSLLSVNAVAQQKHAYVDLGLPSGTKWATCNIGANNPWEDGSYFAWGETKPKKKYTSFGYKYCDDDKLTKYTERDKKKELVSSDDAATANWGSQWCIPSKRQWDELVEYTTQKWTQMNGVNGYKFTSDENGKSIFLPAAGYRDGSNFYGGGSSGDYWSRTLLSGNPYSAWALYFYSGSVGTSSYSRNYGRSVRPVRR